MSSCDKTLAVNLNYESTPQPIHPQNRNLSCEYVVLLRFIFFRKIKFILFTKNSRHDSLQSIDMQNVKGKFSLDSQVAVR